MKTVLAIESSCDETAAAVLKKEADTVKVLSSVVASQADLHSRTQGVVPEVAARAHVEAITFVIADAITKSGFSSKDIDFVAATTEPGLRPALVVGESAGRALAAGWRKKFVPVHHIAGHIAAAWLSDGKDITHNFPAVVLVVSGGHTQLFELNEGLSLKLLGQTRDDAAGEAFDKIARLLGLPYPGGPELSKLAEKGDPHAFDLPRPMADSHDSDFSFSGLKTAVLYRMKDQVFSDADRANMAASAQEAIVDVLILKTKMALESMGAKEVAVVGGVAANRRLREKMARELGVELIFPDLRYCTDNAAMIGAAALLGFQLPIA